MARTDLTEKLDQIVQVATEGLEKGKFDKFRQHSPKLYAKMPKHWEHQLVALFGFGTALQRGTALKRAPVVAYFKEEAGDQAAQEYSEWYHNVVHHLTAEEGLEWTTTKTMARLAKVHKAMVNKARELFPDTVIPEKYDLACAPVRVEQEHTGKTASDGGGVYEIAMDVPGQGTKKVVLKMFPTPGELLDEFNFTKAYVELGHPVLKPIERSVAALCMTTPFKGRDYRFLCSPDTDEDTKKRLAQHAVLTNMAVSLDVTRGIEDLANQGDKEKWYATIKDRSEANRGTFRLDGQDNFKPERLLVEFFGRYDEAFGTNTSSDLEIVPTIAAYKNTLLKRVNEMPKLVGHGDFHQGNVLTENGDDEGILLFDFKSYMMPYVYDMLEFVGRIGFNQPDLEEVLQGIHPRMQAQAAEQGIALGDYDQFKRDFETGLIDVYLRNAMIMLKQATLKQREEPIDDEEIKELQHSANWFYTMALETLNKYADQDNDKDLRAFGRLLEDNVSDVLENALARIPIDPNKGMGFKPEASVTQTVEDWMRPKPDQSREELVPKGKSQLPVPASEGGLDYIFSDPKLVIGYIGEALRKRWVVRGLNDSDVTDDEVVHGGLQDGRIIVEDPTRHKTFEIPAWQSCYFLSLFHDEDGTMLYVRHTDNASPPDLVSKRYAVVGSDPESIAVIDHDEGYKNTIHQHGRDMVTAGHVLYLHEHLGELVAVEFTDEVSRALLMINSVSLGADVAITSLLPGLAVFGKPYLRVVAPDDKEIQHVSDLNIRDARHRKALDVLASGRRLHDGDTAYTPGVIPKVIGINPQVEFYFDTSFDPKDAGELALEEVRQDPSKIMGYRILENGQT